MQALCSISGVPTSQPKSFWLPASNEKAVCPAHTTIFVCPTTLLAPIIKETTSLSLYHLNFCPVWTPTGGFRQSERKLHNSGDSRQWCQRQPPCIWPAHLWDTNHGGGWQKFAQKSAQGYFCTSLVLVWKLLVEFCRLFFSRRVFCFDFLFALLICMFCLVFSLIWLWLRWMVWTRRKHVSWCESVMWMTCHQPSFKTPTMQSFLKSLYTDSDPSSR